MSLTLLRTLGHLEKIWGCGYKFSVTNMKTVYKNSECCYSWLPVIEG